MNTDRYSNISPYYSPNPIKRMTAVMAPKPDNSPYVCILDAIKQCRTDLDIREHNVVMEMRKDGATWSAIGGLLGITKQAAQQRFS